jgi:hypothetical protein
MKESSFILEREALTHMGELPGWPSRSQRGIFISREPSRSPFCRKASNMIQASILSGYNEHEAGRIVKEKGWAASRRGQDDCMAPYVLLEPLLISSKHDPRGRLGHQAAVHIDRLPGDIGRFL